MGCTHETSARLSADLQAFFDASLLVGGDHSEIIPCPAGIGRGHLWLTLHRTGPASAVLRALDVSAPFMHLQMRGEGAQALLELERNQRLIVDGASDFIYILDIKRDELRLSPSAFAHVDLPPAQSLPLDAWVNVIHPDDLSLFQTSIDEVLSGRGDVHDAQYRVRKPGGGYTWVHCRGKCGYNAQGEPEVMAGSIKDITINRSFEEELRRAAHYDALTGLCNRLSFETELASCLQGEGAQGAVLLIDIDDFKNINDLFGHNLGDELLRVIAAALQGMIQYAGTTLYRFGGDEFIIHAPGVNRQTVAAWLERFFRRAREPWALSTGDYYCTMSVGVAFYPDHGMGVEEIFKKADTALFKAKHKGKNAMAVYAEDDELQRHRSYRIEVAMRTSEQQGFAGFQVYYQPIVDGRTQSIIGAEALLRLRLPDGEMVMPGDFIRLAEYLGIILPLGAWVLRQAALQCKAWRAICPGFVMNVNVSSVQCTRGDLYHSVAAALQEAGLPGDALQLEITETVLLDGAQDVMALLGRVRALGVRVALDDFSTGYSSMAVLRKLPVNCIKVDRSFVRDMLTDRYQSTFVRFIVELAHSIDMQACVEGVETQEEWEAVAAVTPDCAQGFLWSQPVPAAQLQAMLRA